LMARTEQPPVDAGGVGDLDRCVAACFLFSPFVSP
jgi:hypothetical protein